MEVSPARYWSGDPNKMTVETFVLSVSAGRILNRFTKDIGFMDELLPKTFFDFLQVCVVIDGVH